MKKLSLLALCISVVLLSMGRVIAQHTEEDRAQFNQLLAASPQLVVEVTYGGKRRSTIIDGKRHDVISQHKSKRSGSGVIIGRSKDKTDKHGLPYTYYVLTCRHNFEIVQSGKPLSLSRLKNLNVWMRILDYQGESGITARIQASATLEWWSNDIDAAVISFKSAEKILVVPIARKLPRNLFGYSAICIGHPYRSVTIMEGLLGANTFYQKDHLGTVGFNTNFVIGLSGAGIYIKIGDTWKLMGIAMYFVQGNAGVAEGSMGAAIRIDFILAALDLIGKEHLARVE